MEDDYQKVADAILRQVLEQNTKLKNIRPNTNSQFLIEYDKIKATSMGGITFVTLYTGGVLQTTHQQYKELYARYYTRDIIKKSCILALTEICPNSIGVRCYFEFDYRSFIRLPTEIEMIEHIKMSQILIKQSFPQKDGNDCTLHVAKCTPKIKYAAASKNEKGKLAIGLHLVFAQIIVDTQELRQLALTLDARITSHNPFFSGSVDAASVHKDSASLRPLYAYRLDECEGCYTVRKGSIKQPNKTKVKNESKSLKNEKSWCGDDLMEIEQETNYDSESEIDMPLLQTGLICESEGCIKGKKFASPSIYKPWFILLEDGETIDYFDDENIEEDDIKNWIEDMSIVPPFGLKRNIYCKVIDAIEIDILSNKNGSNIIFKLEKTLFTKQGVRFSSQSHTDLYTSILEIIHDFDKEHYSNVGIASILFTPRSCTLLVALKGCRQKHYCLLKNDYHGSNRIFFFLKLKSKKRNKSEIRLCCRNKICNPILTWYHKDQKPKNKNERKLIKLKDDIQITPLQKMLLSQTSKEIPSKLRKQVMNLLHLNESKEEIEYFKENEEESGSLEGLRQTLPDGNSIPVKLFYDERIAMLVTKEELSLPPPTKKRNIKDINPCYFFENDPIIKKDEVILVEETSLHDREMAFNFMCDQFLKN